MGGGFLGKLKKILIVDNDKSTFEIINTHIIRLGYEIKKCNNAKEILNIVSEFKPNIILLDIMLKEVGGLEVLKSIRNVSQIPIIILTSRADLFTKVLALELGADDYVLKPFEKDELLARIKAIMRRCNHNEGAKNIIRFPNLIIDEESYSVVYKEKEIKMPPKEFELLYYLASNKNKVFTREELLYEVWGYDYIGDSRTVDVHIKRIREKVSDEEVWNIKTVWGIGYKFELKDINNV